MRKPLLVVGVALFVAACSDAPTGPANPLGDAPTVRLSHMGTGGESTADDLCDGFSPCDGYGGYFHQNIAAPGFCFLPPMVDNHTSDPACAGALLRGLGGFFELAWCQVSYADVVFDANGFPTSAPEIVQCSSARVPFTEGGGFYSASVRFRKPDEGKIFRLYVVHDDQHFAHRDVIVHPNETRPADDYLHAIGTGTEPVKVVITEAFTCAFFDTQEGGTDNAASCLIAGETSFSFASDANGLQFNTTFNFPDGNEPFFANVEVSECRSLWFDPDDEGPDPGKPLVDVPLGGCMVSLSSEELQQLTVPGQITLDLFGSTPFPANARPNVLQYDEFGIGALPPSEAPVPDWLGVATSTNVGYRLLQWGRDKLHELAAFFGPEPVYAWPGSGWDFTRLSDFQLSWNGVVAPGVVGDDCADPRASCVDLGVRATGETVALAPHVTAPGIDGSVLDVPGTRLHVFTEPGSGAITCAASPGNGQACHADGMEPSPDSSDPPIDWGHVVGITGDDGRLHLELTAAEGLNVVNISGCVVARPGDGTNEPNPLAEPGADNVWGELIPATDARSCVDREAGQTAAGAFDNGAADDDTPFEPARLNVANGPFNFEHGVYGLPVTYEVRTCPEILIDGDKDPGEWDCAEPIGFIAPVKGPQPTSDNAWLYTYNDGDALYIGLEVINNELGNKIFINLVDELVGGNLVAAADDDLLLLDFGDPTVKKDWYYTQACVGNNASSLCGAPDTDDDEAGFGVEAAAKLAGAGSGRVFYEFKRPFGANPEEDLDALPGDLMGLRVQVTQGQGGGKGGFVYPDDGTFYRFGLD